MKSVNHKDRLLIENLSDAYAYHQIVTDSEGSPVDDIFLEVNPAFEKMTGLKRENIIGKKVTEVLPGIKHSSFDWISTFGRIVQTGEMSHFELYFEPLRRYYEVTAYAEDDSSFSVIFKDITERKEKKERTKELGFLQSFSLLLRKEGDDLEKILAETAKLLPPSFQYPQLACACITFEERQYKTKSYQTTPLKISSTLKAQDQQVGTIEVCYLEHPGQDLDPEPFLKDEKIMLDMVAENLGQVIERNRLGRDRSNIFKLSKDMIGYAGLDGNVIEINPACEKILGWNQEKFVGSSLWDNIHSEDMDATNKTMETLADGKPLEGFTNRLRCTDGSYRWISWSFYPELDLQRIFFAARDITGAIKAEEELRYAHDQLEAKVKERTADLELALKQLQPLRNIDMAITGSLDLRVTFKAILDEVTSLLNVDGAAILRLDPNTATLNYEAWRGFNTADPKSFNLHWGEEFAGRVAKDRETVHIADLNEKEKDQVQRPLMDQEGFRS